MACQAGAELNPGILPGRPLVSPLQLDKAIQRLGIIIVIGEKIGGVLVFIVVIG